MATNESKILEMLNTSDATNLDPTRPHLDRAFKTLSNKLPTYNNLWEYYDGNQPLMYTAKRMADLFEDLHLATFNENWCAVVVDSANDKINLSNISSKDKKANKRLQEYWETHNLALEAKDVHEAALVIGESYIIIWPDQETSQSEIYYNDPRLVHLFYDPANPRKKWYGAKWWVDGMNHLRMNLFFYDSILA